MQRVIGGHQTPPPLVSHGLEKVDHQVAASESTAKKRKTGNAQSIWDLWTDLPGFSTQKTTESVAFGKMEDLVLCDKSSVFGATCLHKCKTVHVFFEIFDRFGVFCGAATGHDSADEALHARQLPTDLGVDLPLTKLQYTALAEGRRAKVEDEGGRVTRHLLPVPLRMIGIHFPPPRRPRLAKSSCACDASASCTRNSTAGRGRAVVAKGQRVNQTAGTSHSTCRLRRYRLVPERPWLQWRPKPKHHATHHVFDQTGNFVRFCNYGDESAIGWASNVSDTVQRVGAPSCFDAKPRLSAQTRLSTSSQHKHRLTGLSTEPLVTHCTPLRHPNHRLHQRGGP